MYSPRSQNFNSSAASVARLDRSAANLPTTTAATTSRTAMAFQPFSSMFMTTREPLRGSGQGDGLQAHDGHRLVPASTVRCYPFCAESGATEAITSWSCGSVMLAPLSTRPSFLPSSRSRSFSAAAKAAAPAGSARVRQRSR